MAGHIKLEHTSEGSDQDESDGLYCRPTKKTRLLPDVEENQSHSLSQQETCTEETADQCKGEDCSIVSVLPDEVLEHIFTFLNIKQRFEAELVCKSWQWLNRNITWSWPRKLFLRGSRPWRTSCEFLGPYYDISKVLSRCGPNLRQLKLDDLMTGYLKTMFPADVKNCRNITDLSLSHIAAVAFCVETVAQSCKKLKCLKLSHDVVTESDLFTVTNHFRLLECLQVSACTIYATGECFIKISKHLKVLWLDGLFVHLGNTVLKNLTDRCDFIQDLRLISATTIEADLEVSGMLSKVTRYYKATLKRLFLDGWSHVTNWNEVILVLRNLEHLGLNECSHVQDHLCRDLVDNCAKLKTLEVAHTKITDAGLLFLASLPHLTVLDIRHLSLTDSGITRLAIQGRLVNLHICGVEGLANPDECFAQLALLCPNLRLLDVSYNENVSNNLVHAFVEALTKGKLQAPFVMIAYFTLITENVEKCEGLSLFLELNDLFTGEGNDGEGPDWVITDL